MRSIPQKELRNDIGSVLRDAEAGERFVITVSGRPVAELGPLPKERWVSGERLASVWATPPPDGLLEDLEAFATTLADPFE